MATPPRPSRPPFFGNALTLGVRAPGKLQLCTVGAASLRVYLGSTRDGPAVPVSAAFAVARGSISEPALRSQPGTLGRQPGARTFPSAAAAALLLPPLLRVPGPADTGVGGAESWLRAGRGWRLLRWNRPIAEPFWLCDSCPSLAPNARSRSSPLSLGSPHSLEINQDVK